MTLNMMKKILAASISAALLGLPAAAPAQDAETEAVEQAPASAVQYSINYDVTADPDTVWLLDLSNGERVAIRLMPGWAPNHVERVKTLTRTGFYDGVIFHRVIDGFMAQGGDPTGTGQGGSAMPDLEEEFNSRPHIRGTVSMARATDENSANSQFFIVFYPRFSLDKRYTNFGRVISNMDGVDTITRGEPPANPTRILQASIASDNKPQLFPQPEAPVEEEITADLLSAPLN